MKMLLLKLLLLQQYLSSIYSHTIHYPANYNSIGSYIALHTFQYGYRNNDTAKLLSNRNYILSHLRSISTLKNTTFIYFTDHIETHFAFPSNCIQILIPWTELVTKLEELVNVSFPALRASTNYYKLCDFKPLMKVFYPEYFNQYKWVGWIDNDLWFSSDLEKFILDYGDKGYSQLSLREDKKRISWGPISVFDWNFYHTFVSNELKSEKYRQVLTTVFNKNNTVSFTEWGASIKNGFNLSMSNILVNVYSENKDLKYLKAYQVINKEIVGMRNDNHCRNKKNKNRNCAQCTLKVKDGRSTLFEFKEQQNITTATNTTNYEGVFMCHFQSSKKNNLHPKNTTYIVHTTISDVLSAATIESSYSKGWSLTAV